MSRRVRGGGNPDGFVVREWRDRDEMGEKLACRVLECDVTGWSVRRRDECHQRLLR